MNRRTAQLGVCAVIGGGCALTAFAAPKAELTADTWQLAFEFHDPQRIILQLQGEAAPVTYWYLLYEVTNNTGQEVDFYPSFRLVTDTLQVVIGGEGVHPRVYDAIKARHRLEYPFFTRPAKVIGPILQGEENARVSAAVFRDFDRNANSFDLYVSGLSGDVTRVFSPAQRSSSEDNGAGSRSFLLRRALAIHYDFPGDPITRAQAVPVRRSRQWVMR